MATPKNQPQQARIGGGKIDYGAPGARSLDSY